MSMISNCFVSVLVTFTFCPPTNGELVDQLNTLLSQPGWQYMDFSVCKPFKGKGKQLKLKDNEIVEDDNFVPASELLEVKLPGDHTITLKNQFVKYKNVLIVLQCKYAEVTTVHMLLVKNLIDACRLELDTSINSFLACFDVVLNKISSIAVTMRYMRDALRFFEMITPTASDYYTQCAVLRSLKTFEAFTSRTPEEANKILNLYESDKRKRIFAKRQLLKFLGTVIKLTKNQSNFLTRYCLVPHQIFMPEFLTDDFVERVKNKILSLPSEESLLDYIGHKINSYSGHIIKNYFYRLGFLYEDPENPEKVTFNLDILS